MSYRVWYNLEISGLALTEEQKSNILTALHKQLGPDACIDDEGNGVYESKWEPEDDLIPFSKENPDILFTLHCTGDDDDRWYEYYLNGKKQHCQGEIVYEEFDVTKMK